MASTKKKPPAEPVATRETEPTGRRVAMSKTVAAALLEKTRAMGSTHTRSNFDLGGLLWQISIAQVDDQPFWVAFGADTWGDFLEKNLGLTKSFGGQARSTFWTFEVRLKDKWDRKLVLPWSKMVLLSRVVDEDNVNGWLRSSKDKPVGEVLKAVQAARGKQLPLSLYSYHFQLADAEFPIVDQAMTIARGVTQSKRKGQLLAHICANYVAHQSKKLPKPGATAEG